MLVTNHTVTIAAELVRFTIRCRKVEMKMLTNIVMKEDGSNLVGQCNISHPASSTGVPSIELSPPEDALHEAKPVSINAVFEKDAEQPLSSRIKRGGNLIWCRIVTENFLSGIYYINAHGHEIHPTPNPDFLANLGSRDVLLYSCGSLWTR